MVSKFQRATGGGKDLHAVGRSVMDMWSAAMARGTRSRNTNPRVERAIIDLAHREVVHDPFGTMRKIHDRFGLRLSEEHIERMARFLHDSRSAQRLGQHRHDPAEFGLEATEVRQRLADYYARFGHLLAKA
jgi:type II secretory pathway component PulJ